MTSQRSHVKTMCFSVFSYACSVQGMVKSSLSENLVPTHVIEYLLILLLL